MKFFLLFSVFTGMIFLASNNVNSQIPRLPSIRPSATPSPSPSPATQRTESPSPAGASTSESTGGGEYPKHFFFTTEAKATSKVLKAQDLVACIFGDNANPSNKNAFKKVVPTVGGQKGRVIDAGTCDVVVLVVRNAEVEKNLQRDNAGFAVYKIVGDDLELLFKPEAGQHVAVGTIDLAGSETLSKIDLRGCGPSELRNSYRPNPNTWKNWANHFIDADRMSRLTPEASPLGRSCDVWIMTPEIHMAFVKRFGNKYPIFDVSPSDPVLRQRK